jgi:hypothetical protein
VTGAPAFESAVTVHDLERRVAREEAEQLDARVAGGAHDPASERRPALLCVMVHSIRVNA